MTDEHDAARLRLQSSRTHGIGHARHDLIGIALHGPALRRAAPATHIVVTGTRDIRGGKRRLCEQLERNGIARCRVEAGPEAALPGHAVALDEIASVASSGPGTPRMNMGLRNPPAATTLRVIPSVPASSSMRVALLVQPAKNRARSSVAVGCMTTIATRITTNVNDRGHSSTFRAMPGMAGTYGRCCSRSGAVTYAEPRSSLDC